MKQDYAPPEASVKELKLLYSEPELLNNIVKKYVGEQSQFAPRKVPLEEYESALCALEERGVRELLETLTMRGKVLEL